MEFKLLLCGAILLSSWAFVGNSQGVGGSDGASMPCVQKLLPCQPYLKSPSPPPQCCIPLKQMISDDKQCLCEIFDNAELLKSFNITKDDALQLPKSCGAHADINQCKNVTPVNETATPPTSSTSIPSTPSVSNSTGSSSANSTTEKSAACGRSFLSGFRLLALTISLFI